MAINLEYIDGLSNADGMDSVYYNAVSAEQINQGVQIGTQVISALRKPTSQTDDEINGVCGKKPFFLAGKKKKQAYQKCVGDYLKQKNTASAPAPSTSSNNSSSNTNYSNNSQDLSQRNSTPAKKKFLGMPVGLGITVAILLSAGVVTGGYLLVKKFAFKH